MIALAITTYREFEDKMHSQVIQDLQSSIRFPQN